jgi:2-aminoethylphosphonate-pyruvate transaminase
MRISMAVVLAAGRGTRLAGAGLAIPKGLVEIGGETLVSRSARLMALRGITDIVLVTGYQAERYEAFAVARSGVRCIYNRRFAEMGSLESLRCALEAVNSPFLLLDSDILYESRGLDILLEQPAANDALVSGLTGSGDEYYAWADEASHIRHLSKSLTARPEPPAGEHVGIVKIGESLRNALLAKASAWLRECPMDSYETLLVDLLATHSLKNVYVPDLQWSEIDNLAMLNTARNVIWPRLLKLGDT